MYACFAVFICNINKEVVSYFACTYISITKERPAREFVLFTGLYNLLLRYKE